MKPFINYLRQFKNELIHFKSLHAKVKNILPLLILWVLVVNTTFAQEIYNFNNAGATGATGPGQADVNNEYSGSNLSGEVTVTGAGIQEWVVPRSGIYQITAAGAAGGSPTGGNVGGSGAVIEGEFVLTTGDVVEIIVGQKGTDSYITASGGGGSFVVANGTLKIAAGGGGGATPDNDAADAVVGQNGTNDYPNGTTAGGTNGNGGAACVGSGANHGGGGGGYTGDGSTSTGNSPGDGGFAFVNGGQGGTNASEGGFGGGGGAGTTNHGGGGGGGGYSGGAGGQQVNHCTPGINRSGGGGGGSFNIGDNQNNQGGANYGHGYVDITFIGGGGLDIMANGVEYPEAFIAGNQDLGVSVRNGEINVGSFNVGYQLGSNTPVEYTNYQPVDSIEEDETYVVDFTGNDALDIPSAGNYNLKIWATNPNQIYPDSFPGNDTMYIDICTANQGLWTIDHTGAGDFETFTEAFEYFGKCGLSGDVTFLVEPGDYEESVYVDELPGIGPNATLTIDGQDSSDVRLFSGQRTLEMSNISHVHFENMTIEAESDQPDDEALFLENVDNFSFEMVHFKRGESQDTEVNTLKLLDAEDISVTNSSFRRGGTAIKGVSGNNHENILINNNIFELTGFSAITLESFQSVGVNENEFIMDSDGDDEADILVLQNVSGSEIERNKFRNAGRSAIRLENENSSQIHTSRVINNKVYGEFRSDASMGGGIFAANASNLQVYHNSIYQNFQDADVVHFTGSGTNNEVKNNIFQYAGGGSGQVIYNNGAQFSDLDFNIYHSNGSNLVMFNGNSHSLLSDYQNASGEDANSYELNPGFVAHDDLRLASAGQIRTGATGLNVTVDFYGIDRDDNQPVIGAHEGTVTDLGIDALVFPEDDVCGISEQEVRVVLNNIGMQDLSGFDINVEVTGDFSDQMNYNHSGTISGYTDNVEVTLGDIDTRAGGTVEFMITHDVPDDENPNNDTLIVSRTFKEAPELIMSNKVVCGAQSSVTLEVQSSNASLIEWYNIPQGGNVLNTGNEFTLYNISTSNTFFVEGTHANNGCETEIRRSISLQVINEPEVTFVDDSSAEFVMNDGTEGSPDEIFYSGLIHYEIVPPPGRSNSEYGTTWEIDDVSFTDETGASPSDWNYTEPSGGTPGSLSFTPVLGETGNTYELEMELTDLENGCEGVAERFIKVRPAPVAEFTHSGDVCFGEEVNFDNVSDVPADNDATFEWRLGDGTVISTDSDSSITFEYQQAGEFEVTLHATGDHGGKTTYQVNVTINNVPDVSFETSEGEPYCTGSNIDFINMTEENQTNPSYTWNFGDGEQTSGFEASHSYDQTGSYSIILTAESDQGCIAEDEKNIDVDAMPNAAFDWSGIACEENTIEFSTDSQETGNDHNWHFGNAGTSDEQNPAFTFNEAGSFEISHQVTAGSGCENTEFQTLEINELPNSEFTYEESNGVEYTFEAIEGNHELYFWDFGDGTADSSGAVVTHEYTENGTYDVELSVTSHEGCESDYSETFEIISVGLIAPLVEFSGSFEAYPNPFSDVLNIELALEYSGKVTLQLYDVSGRMQLSRSIGMLNKGEHQLSLNTSEANLSEGTYILRIDTGNGVIGRNINFSE